MASVAQDKINNKQSLFSSVLVTIQILNIFIEML